MLFTMSGFCQSEAVPQKQFNKEHIEELRDSGDFDYIEAKPAQTSLLQRIWNYIIGLINGVFNAATGTPVGRVLLYIALFVLLLAAIIKLFNVDVKDVFYKSSDKSSLAFDLEEHIENLDIEKMLSEALAERHYRLAVRLVYLKALKALSEAHLVEWEDGKTNHEYLIELKEQSLRSEFSQLSYFFDYAWYGDFEVNEKTYQEANAHALNVLDKTRINPQISPDA